jgi:hypothetical protein
MHRRCPALWVHSRRHRNHARRSNFIVALAYVSEATDILEEEDPDHVHVLCRVRHIHRQLPLIMGSRPV